MICYASKSKFYPFISTMEPYYDLFYQTLEVKCYIKSSFFSVAASKQVTLCFALSFCFVSNLYFFTKLIGMTLDHLSFKCILLWYIISILHHMPITQNQIIVHHHMLGTFHHPAPPPTFLWQPHTVGCVYRVQFYIPHISEIMIFIYTTLFQALLLLLPIAKKW